MKQDFEVRQAGKIVGRMSAMVNPDIHYKTYKVGLCGYYECIDDPNVAQELFEQVMAFHNRQGNNYLIGPMNGSTWGSYRITEPPFNPPFFLDNISEGWYKAQFLENGFDIIARYHSTKMDRTERCYQRLEKFERLFAEKGVKIRPFNFNHFEEDLNSIYTISINSFNQNFLYTPITYQDFASLYVKIKHHLNPEFILLAEYEGNPIGFIFAVDDFNNPHEKTLILKTLAVVPSLHTRGLGTVLTEALHKKAFEGGYQSVIHALMHEGNLSNNILSVGSSVYQRYALFGREIAS